MTTNLTTAIHCPKCDEVINVSDILRQQVQQDLTKDFLEKEEGLRIEFNTKQAEIDKRIEIAAAKMNAEKRQFEKAQEALQLEKENLSHRIASQVAVKIAEERKTVEVSIAAKIKGETEEQLAALQKELEEKSTQVKELNKSKAEIEKLKREKEEMADAMKLQMEQEYSTKMQEERQKIKKQADENSQFKIKELEKQLEDQRYLAEEMKRKAEQGSMQLQGEVQELALQELLSGLFPYDHISEVGKGIKGADVVQRVHNHIGAACGVILYESKRTKAFGADWIAKLKADALLAKADLLVIVTEALPDGVDRVGLKDGVWICTYTEVRPLVLVLRDSLIKIHQAQQANSNKGDKMQMLYDYLTGREFRQQYAAIQEGFAELQKGYIDERNAMEKIWKKREKQLERIMLNSVQFQGSIEGIAGSDIMELKSLSEAADAIEI